VRGERDVRLPRMKIDNKKVATRKKHVRFRPRSPPLAKGRKAFGAPEQSMEEK